MGQIDRTREAVCNRIRGNPCILDYWAGLVGLHSLSDTSSGLLLHIGSCRGSMDWLWKNIISNECHNSKSIIICRQIIGPPVRRNILYRTFPKGRKLGVTASNHFVKYLGFLVRKSSYGTSLARQYYRVRSEGDRSHTRRASDCRASYWRSRRDQDSVRRYQADTRRNLDFGNMDFGQKSPTVCHRVTTI